MSENSKMIVPLHETWCDVSRQNPKGPPTYVRREYKSNFKNYLQLSITNYVQGKLPNPTKDDLIKLAENAGASFGKLIKTNSGICKFGIFGTAFFHSKENPITQIWYLSNGKDFILASYICSKNPNISELQETESIVLNAYITA